MSIVKDNFFIEALRFCLDKKIKTRKEVCEYTGIYSGRLSQIINNKYSAGIRVQEKIANAFGYDLDRFLSLGRRLSGGEKPEFNDDSIDEVVQGEGYKDKLLATQEKYIAQLEAENARLRRLLSSVEERVEGGGVPPAQTQSAFGGATKN